MLDRSNAITFSRLYDHFDHVHVHDRVVDERYIVSGKHETALVQDAIRLSLSESYDGRLRTVLRRRLGVLGVLSAV